MTIEQTYMNSNLIFELDFFVNVLKYFGTARRLFWIDCCGLFAIRKWFRTRNGWLSTLTTLLNLNVISESSKFVLHNYRTMKISCGSITIFRKTIGWNSVHGGRFMFCTRSCWVWAYTRIWSMPKLRQRSSSFSCRSGILTIELRIWVMFQRQTFNLTLFMNMIDLFSETRSVENSLRRFLFRWACTSTIPDECMRKFVSRYTVGPVESAVRK